MPRTECIYWFCSVCLSACPLPANEDLLMRNQEVVHSRLICLVEEGRLYIITQSQSLVLKCCIFVL